MDGTSHPVDHSWDANRWWEIFPVQLLSEPLDQGARKMQQKGYPSFVDG